MTIRQLSFAAALSLVAGTAAAVEGGPSAAVDSAAPAPAAAPADAVAPPAAPAGHQVALGPAVKDANGQDGRLHTVAKGDTLWAISDAYLGTPWLWPSLWHANETEIKDPHWIYPGQQLFISGSTIRPVSPAEAAQMAAGSGAPITPAAPTPFHFSAPEFTGFVATEHFDTKARVIAGMPGGRSINAMGDVVTIGVGAGSVRVGDELTLFRVTNDAVDPTTGQVIGYQIDSLGWGVVTDVLQDSAQLQIRASKSEVMPGDGVYPRNLVNTEIRPTASPSGLEGAVLSLPASRTQMGQFDIVYLDRGAADGVAVGNAFEVYRPRYGLVADYAGADGRRIADQVLGRVIVVETQSHSAVGLVTASSDSITRGDRFRSASR
ncbi:MAG TPA: LysM peptidoglycan-binding domain-containing protein [Myxococcota bacterium]|jgi:hypothetical protein|nr:LysM peptidoglycan-binding domain-containing protein [Myxococcota bacterium]